MLRAFTTAALLSATAGFQFTRNQQSTYHGQLRLIDSTHGLDEFGDILVDESFGQSACKAGDACWTAATDHVQSFCSESRLNVRLRQQLMSGLSNSVQHGTVQSRQNLFPLTDRVTQIAFGIVLPGL